MVSIEIEDPEKALRVLDRLSVSEWGLNEPSEMSVYIWKRDLRTKIEVAMLRDKFSNVWRQVESFPNYEISGGGLVRNRLTREQVGITAIFGEEVMIKLDDRNGWETEVSLGKLVVDNFPEFKDVQ